MILGANAQTSGDSDASASLVRVSVLGGNVSFACLAAAVAAKAAGGNMDPILRPFFVLGWAYTHTHANKSALGSFLYAEQSRGGGSSEF